MGQNLGRGKWVGGDGKGKGYHILLKYLDQFLMVLLETFKIGLVFVRELKQRAATLCLDQN